MNFDDDLLIDENFSYNEEFTSFADAMKGVKKIKQNTIERKTPIMDPKVSQMLKDMHSDEKKEEDLGFFSTANMVFVDPNDNISYKTPGLQYGVMKKLKSGEYLPQDGIDLHNNTVENAYIKVRKLIIKAYRQNIRCILIIHGKGEFCNPKALLKSYVAHWLKQMPEVLAYHTAMPYHGDKGATYVLIKKGDEARIETRENFARR
ncbi:MAG: DNA endonuclease SmrA [Succinivibrionaceae bacterium]